MKIQFNKVKFTIETMKIQFNKVTFNKVTFTININLKGIDF